MKFYCENCFEVFSDPHICKECGARSCPNCGSNQLVRACDFEGCKIPATIGKKTALGYLWVCCEHVPVE